MNILLNINHMSFQAIHKPRDIKFSDSQKKVIKDIENKITPNMDLYVEPGAYKDAVELSKITNLTKDANKTKSNHIKQINLSYIGTYDEEHLFDLKDLTKNEKKNKRKESSSLTFLFGIISAILSLMVCARCASKTKNDLPIAKEQVHNIYKNEIQNFSNDSLNLTKRLLKK